MSEKRVINANEFINKAVKLVEIDGFEDGEKFVIKIKPVSLLGMMTNGKLPNELKAQVASLFNQGAKKKNDYKINNVEELALMQELMDKVCQECMVEPRYEEIGQYMTDTQKTQVFSAAQGNVKQFIPSDKK